MRVDVVMPQMGESIAEGTITRWLKQVGDRVEHEEPVFEISTDKVDAEIPSPASGVVVEIHGAVGDTVEVNTVVAVIETEAGAVAAPSDTEEGPDTREAAPDAPAPSEPESTAPAPSPSAPSPPAPSPSSVPSMVRAPGAPSKQAGRRFVSPVVRKIAAEHGIDPEVVTGSGAGGRVTKRDILAFIEAGGAARPAAPTAAAPGLADPAPPPAALTAQPDAPVFVPGEPTTRVAMTQMRKKIAEHMIASRRTSAHVNSVFEVDMTRAVALREKYKRSYVETHGTKLTYMAFLIKAACDALRAWPIVNATVDGEEIIYNRDLNIGIAVALDWGLIVPVIRNADEISVAGLCQRVADIAERARTKKLSPDEVHGGTFTLTNPGVFGSLFGLPIINQPQVAILGVGGLKKRPVVINDAIAIRSMVYMVMSYDHRVVDGAVADQFLSRVKHTLENFDESLL
jgi:2-oxoglutarate dehydrogenase E2 component (dihydrolipoamide succinyltransferase)